MKNKNLIKAIAFVCLLLTLYVFVTRLFMPKWVTDTAPTIMADQLYSLEENSVDICILGSSQTSYGISAMRMLDKYGVSAFNTGTGSQPTIVAYFYLKEMDKTQELKAVFFEISMLFEKVEESRIKMAVYSAPFSRNKMELVNEFKKDSDFDEIVPYYITLIQNHSRWDDLGESDFAFRNTKTKMYRGSILKDGARDYLSKDLYITDIQEIDESVTINSDEERYLYSIIDYCKENNLPLVLFKTPKFSWNRSKQEIVKKIAEENGLAYLDFNTQELSEAINLNYDQDFTDPDHLNVRGADKLSDYLAEYALENFKCSDAREAGNFDKEEMESYYIEHEYRYFRSTNDPSELFSAINERGYEVVLEFSADIKDKFDQELISAFSEMGIDVDNIGRNYIAYCADGKCIYEDTGNEKVAYTGKFSNNKEFIIESDTDSKDAPKILVGGNTTKYSRKGVNMAIYDADANRLIWCPTIYINENGELKVK